MRWRAELSDEAEKQLSRLPRDVRDRMESAIDEFEEKDEAQWSNIKALRGREWKGRFRKRVGSYRIIFQKFSGNAASWRSRPSSSDPKVPTADAPQPIADWRVGRRANQEIGVPRSSLLPAERGHRIDPCRSARRDVACEGGHGGDSQRSGGHGE